MDIYLPIAEYPVNALLVVLLAATVGVFSGFFGIGGGFLITPLLFLLGIPLPVVVGTQSAQILASSVSAAYSHIVARNIDIKLGLTLAVGGLIGAGIGVTLFRLLVFSGQLELILSLGYILLLSTICILILVEIVNKYAIKKSKPVKHKTWQQSLRRTIFIGLPHRVRYPLSRLYVSVYVPLSVGALVGVVSAILGIGGGIILIPVLMYLFQVPARIVVGTGLVQAVFISTGTLFLQASINRTVDVVLALLLIIGGPIGAQLGVGLSRKIQPATLRSMLACTVLSIAVLLVLKLTLEPSYRYSLLFLR